MPKHQEGRSAYRFFFLTIVYSWVFWMPFVLNATGVIDLGFELSMTDAGLVAAVGGFGPLAAALTLVMRRHGGREAWRFFCQVFDVRTRPVYYLLALLVPLLIVAIAHFLAPLLRLQVSDRLIPEEIGSTWVIFVPYFIAMLVFGGGQEEWGWRGYAQQPLQERLGVLKASLTIGVVWGLWHLPLWTFSPGNAAYSFVAFLIHTTSVSVVYGWLYNAAGRKLIIPLLFHTMANTVAPFLPYLHGIEGRAETAYWLFSALNFLAALTVVYLTRGERLTGPVLDTPARQSVQG